MGVVELFYGLVLAHFIADYMQPAALVVWTKRTGGGLYVHVGIYSILTGIVLYGYGGGLWLPFLLFMSVTHFLLDKLKYYYGERATGWYVWIFLLDQVLHGAVIVAGTAVMAFLTQDNLTAPPFIAVTAPNVRALIGITAMIGAAFGGSILVFESVRTFACDNDAMVVSFKDRLPGIIERSIAGAFLFLSPLVWLTPLPFLYSAGRLVVFWRTDKRKRVMIELLAGVTGFGMACGLFYAKYLL